MSGCNYVRQSPCSLTKASVIVQRMLTLLTRHDIHLWSHVLYVQAHLVVVHVESKKNPYLFRAYIEDRFTLIFNLKIN